MDNSATPVSRAIKAAGNGAKLAQALNIKSRQAVYQWRRIPIEHVLRIESLYGIPRHEQRPDIYPQPERAAS